MYWQQYEVALEQQADALRRAERDRLIRQITAQQAKDRSSLHLRVLVALGSFLVIVGISLQAQALSPKMTPRRA